MQVTSLISQQDGCEDCGHEHSHTNVRLSYTLVGLIFVLNSFLLDWTLSKGSIVAGKFADLTVLSANPLKTPADRLGEIKVLGTVKEGATVFGGPDGGVPITR